MLVNFNLRPEIWSHTENLIPLSVIPGPHSPKALDSFFIPFTEECMALACGIQTYDELMTESFDLHAYLITFSGDLPTISKLLCLWGHGAYCPCCCCLIRGERILGTRNSKYYPVLVPPWQRGVQHKEPYDPWNLPLQTRENLQAQLIEISQAATVSTHGDLGMEYGINHLSMFLCLPSMHFPQSFPHDIMHLFFENICPTLFDQWSQSHKFKLVAPVDPGFQIAPHIWDQIGHETAKAFKTIPSVFVGAMPDITTSKYKVEYWSFWIQYLGPILLHHHFPNAKYYWHYCDLVGIIKQCLQFTITVQEVDEMETSIIRWVEEYEWYEPLLQIYVCYLSIYFQVVLRVWPEEPTSMQLQHPCPYSHTGLHLVVWSSLDNLGIPHGVLLWQVRHSHYISTSSLCDSICVHQAQCAAHTAQNVLLMCVGSSFFPLTASKESLQLLRSNMKLVSNQWYNWSIEN